MDSVLVPRYSAVDLHHNSENQNRSIFTQAMLISIPSFLASGKFWLGGATWLVGVTFVWAGTIKAVAPHVFSSHLSKLGWVPSPLVRPTVTVIAGIETAWGLALILGVAPAVLVPVTAILLGVLTGVSWWGVKSGRTTDCGCYGGYVIPSIAQSMTLNGAFIALLLAAWLMLPGSIDTSVWKLIVVGAAGIAAASVAEASQVVLRRTNHFMIDLSPLKVGRRWRSRWGADSMDRPGELLISYLGPDCPHCKQWVRVLNAMDQSSGLPKVIGVVATSNDRLATFVRESGIRFPIHSIPQTLMNRLVYALPTTLLVASGTIEKHWTGPMPPEFFHRFKDAFFPSDGRPVGGTTVDTAEPVAASNAS